MHDATKQLNALAGDHKESPLGEHEIALRGSRSADQSGRIKCEERPVACIIQVILQLCKLAGPPRPNSVVLGDWRGPSRAPLANTASRQCGSGVDTSARRAT